MDKATLEARRLEVETQFNALQTNKANLQAQMDEAEAELARFQGEYRLINDLLSKFEEPKKSKKANVIDVTAVPGANEEKK